MTGVQTCALPISLKITEAKVKLAYEKVDLPVVVNDSSWEIPALGGFPGCYMKDVANWFTAEDFLALMKDKNDRRIILHDVVAYFDGEPLYSTVAWQRQS